MLPLTFAVDQVRYGTNGRPLISLDFIPPSDWPEGAGEWEPSASASENVTRAGEFATAALAALDTQFSNPNDKEESHQ